MSALLQVKIERTPAEQITTDEVLTRGVASLMPETGLRELLENETIRLYLGIDPTSPKLHLGHLVPLRKLRQFQLLGHNVHLLFGTFTAMIGDPSDKSAARQRLTAEQVEVNVATYQEQAGWVLDLSPDSDNPVQIVNNADWLRNLSFQDVIELASNFTVNQIINRETYRKRLDAGTPLWLHEILYPLLQGYDSYALGVRLEIGGKDQIPNMLAGTTIMKVMANTSKWVMGLKLIEDPSGAKMGKTSGNVVNITELPEVIYEALMSWPDATIGLGLELLTSVPMSIVLEVEEELKLIANSQSSVHPMELKEAFAFRVVSELCGNDDAEYARVIYDAVKRQKQRPPRMSEVILPAGSRVLEALVVSGLASDDSNAQGLLTQGAVKLDGQTVRKDTTIPQGQHFLELGKQSIKNIRKLIIT